VSTVREAKAIAEQDTGGIALSARKIALNGASCGWEVDVHMPKDDRGWRCTVDCDSHSVYTKDRIPNPPLKGHR
jgi:D-serine dehydratase